MYAEHLGSMGDEKAFMMHWGKEKEEGGTVMSFTLWFSDSKVFKGGGKKECVALTNFHNNYIMHFTHKAKLHTDNLFTPKKIPAKTSPQNTKFYRLLHHTTIF